MTLAYHAYHQVDTRIVRIFNTFGPRMRLNDGRVLPTFIGQAIRGEDLTAFGDGSQTRSFCYVDDLVEGIYRLLFSRSEEHTSELQSLMRISYAVFCLKKKKTYTMKRKLNNIHLSSKYTLNRK